MLGHCVLSVFPPNPSDQHPKRSYLPAHLLQSSAGSSCCLCSFLPHRSSLWHFTVALSPVSHLPSILHQFFPSNQNYAEDRAFPRLSEVGNP